MGESSFRRTAGNMNVQNFRPLPERFSRFPWHPFIECQIRRAPIVIRDRISNRYWEPSPLPKRRLKTQSRDYSSARSRAVPLRNASKVEFWTVGSVWKRASVNTLRCLLGCTTGDFSTLWYLQAYHPGLEMGVTMALSMGAGIVASLLLETTLLHFGRDKLPISASIRAAAGMSLISMTAMELVENLIDYNLTGGIVALHDLRFWTAAVLSATGGFLAPLPYNYFKLRRFGKSCH